MPATAKRRPRKKARDWFADDAAHKNRNKMRREINLRQTELDFDRPPPICHLYVDCHDPADQARLAKWLRGKGYEVREVTI